MMDPLTVLSFENPALQIHPVTLPVPFGEFELAGQCWQEDTLTAAVASEYFPIAHSVQGALPVASL